MTFTPADGTTIERKISECRFTLPQGEAFSPVILGAEGDEALLGAVTLEVPGMARPEFVSGNVETAKGRLPDAAPHGKHRRSALIGARHKVSFLSCRSFTPGAQL